MIKMYDFGADTSNVSVNERKAVAWPLAVWSCYIPESETQDINILESLILQLVSKDFVDPKSILCNQVGFNKELIDAAIEGCRDKGYFDKRYKDLHLSKDGKSIIEKYDNPYQSDLYASKNSKKVYLIQDLITKNVVPVFDIYKMPDFYIEDDGALVLHYDQTDGKKPKSASIRTALRYWAKLCNNRRHGIESGVKGIDMTQMPSQEEAEETLFFEDEISWETVADKNSESEDEIKNLSDKEDEEKRKATDKAIRNVTILDDSPEIYYARGFIAINKNAPDEILIISPFGQRLDDWYRTLVNRLRLNDEKFEEEIQYFLEEKKDELKDLIAFGNDLDVSLFNEYPFICNDAEYKAVKATINRLTVSKNRFENGEDDSINFAQALRTAYEASLRLVVKKNPYLLKYRNLTYEEYKNNLQMLVNSYSFINEDVYREYYGFQIYKHMTEVTGEKGYVTAFFALILMDAWNDKKGASMDLLRNIPILPVRLKELTSTLRTEHGKSGEGTVASHGGDAIADLKYSEKMALERYQEFERLFRAIYNRFMEDK